MRLIGLGVSLVLAPHAAQAQESKASEVYRIGDLGNSDVGTASGKLTRGQPKPASDNPGPGGLVTVTRPSVS